MPNDIILVRRNGTAVWSGNSNTKAVDISRYGNNDTFVNSSNVSWTPDGRFGYAVNFTGTNGYIDCGNDASLNITDAMWLRGYASQTYVSAQWAEPHYD